MTCHKSHKKNTLSGFTLVELLVAMAILAMVMTLMFSMLSGSMATWQSGNKRIEAAQNARVGLNIIASDLRRAIASQQISYTTNNGTQMTNTIPFLAVDTPTGTIDLGGGAMNADGSQQLFGVLATGNTNQPFEEFGYLCAYLASDDGTNMVGKKYYLARKSTTSAANSDFYLRGNVTTTFAANTDAFSPIIENCIRLELSYPQTNSSGDINTNSSGQFGFTNTWASRTNLPPGVLVSIWVLDSKTATKLASISSGVLSAAQIGSITNTTAPADATERLLRQGAVRMQRFVPLNKK
jgi:prepilin-type N-terminal cleavage/methylation domain-containing protein